MKDSYKEIEKFLKKSKSVNSATLVVDYDFKNNLREKIMQEHIQSKPSRPTLFSWFNALSVHMKGALLVFLVLLTTTLVFGGGYFISELNKKGIQDPSTTDSEDNEETLLASRIALLDKEVEMRRAGSEDWEDAVAEATLSEGDAVRTSKGARVVIEIDDGSAIRLNENTEIILTSMRPENIIITQEKGETYNRVETYEGQNYVIESLDVEAKAMGTAYIVNSNVKKNKVTVYVYESKVNVKGQKDGKNVNEMKKAVVEKGKKVKISDMTKSEYKQKFAEWNKDQDKEKGYEYDTTKPVVTITEPKNGLEVEYTVGSVTVSGTVSDPESILKKIIVNGLIYWAHHGMNEEGKGFKLNEGDSKKGEFSVDVPLYEGENTITVTGYDLYYNSSSATVTVIKEQSPIPDTFYIINASSPQGGRIFVDWSLSGYEAPYGFKVVRICSEEGRLPVYPGDPAVYAGADSREAWMDGVEAGTYLVRVCIYNGEGQCTRYTAAKTVTVGEGGEVSKITLSGTGANISWTVEGYSDLGFKVVWSLDPTPVYPLRSDARDDFHYYASPEKRTDTINAFAGTNTYYVRVCEYLGGSCGVYSNEITVSLTAE